MAKKRKTLPKDFAELIYKGDIDALKAVYDVCDLNAYGSYSKCSALSFYKVPEELVRWLVAQGADIEARDSHKRTAMHAHASSWCGNIGLIIELGGDIEARDYQGETPLHAAAGSCRVEAVRTLLAHGAEVDAKDNSGRTPLGKMLISGNNANIEYMAEIADLLLDAGAEIRPEMAKFVTRIGENFEFHRENFNKDRLEATDEALAHLYEIFNAAPAPRRIMHDGVSPIIVSPGGWKAQHKELWDLLIPSQGPAKTVQGEVIRITGKIAGELYRNGGANWDSNFKKMLDALPEHFASGMPLDEPEMREVAELVGWLRDGKSDQGIDRLCELAVEWVIKNPNPEILEKPNYKR